MQQMRHRKVHLRLGFSLVEMLVVLAILSILLVMAIPSKSGQVNQVKINESLLLVESYKAQIEAVYRISGEFPTDNDAAGLPAPRQIIGNYLQATYIDRGAFHLELGNKITEELEGKVVSLRPIFVPGAPNAPISWVCGHDTVPSGMIAGGENRTDVEVTHLPLVCR